MANLLSQLLLGTQKIVKPYGVTQVDHWDHIWKCYVNQNVEKGSASTISRRMSGKILPPWEMVAHYAGHGTRCPAELEWDLREYITNHYATQPLRDALRAAIMDVMATLPSEDQEDIRDFWDDSNLANMWAVLLWYAVTSDYADKTRPA